MGRKPPKDKNSKALQLVVWMPWCLSLEVFLPWTMK